jgi:hypothetical protein
MVSLTYVAGRNRQLLDKIDDGLSALLALTVCLTGKEAVEPSQSGVEVQITGTWTTTGTSKRQARPA